MGFLDPLLGLSENIVYQSAVLLVAFVIGLVLLVKGSDVFIEGAASIAKKHGISEHTIGLTLVAFATSIPELAVSAFASYNGKSDIAVGNVVGSNMANMGLVLGVSIIIMAMQTSKTVIKNTVWMLGVTGLLFLFILTGQELTRLEGGIFLLVYLAFMYYIFSYTEEVDVGDTINELDANEFVYMGAGVLGVVLGANFLIDSAVEMATRVGISELVIGLTIVSIGTSLPELASSVTAAKKGKHGISIGNVIGSNIINISLVLGVSAVISPIHVDGKVAFNTMPYLLVVSGLMLFFVRKNLKKYEGVLLLIIYVAFLALMVAL